MRLKANFNSFKKNSKKFVLCGSISGLAMLSGCCFYNKNMNRDREFNHKYKKIIVIALVIVIITIV